MIEGSYLYLGASFVPLRMVLACWRWKEFGRALFALIFLGAGALNLYTALTTPAEYLWFADITPFAFLQQFIRGFFARHIPFFVGTIAVAQLVLAFLLMMWG